MILPATVVLFVLFPAVVLGAERGERCTNQWGESATCTNIYSCKAAMDAIAVANGSKIYAAGIVCGYDTEPLVCCRTVADFAETLNNIVPPESSTQTFTSTSDPLLSTNSPVDLNISANMSAFNQSVPVELSSNVGSDSSQPGVTETMLEIDDVRISGSSQSTTTSTTTSDPAIFTSPPLLLTSDTTSTAAPVTTSTAAPVITSTDAPVAPSSSSTSVLVDSTTINSVEPLQTTEALDPLPLQSNSTSEAPLLNRFSDAPPSSSEFPDSTSNIIPGSSPESSSIAPESSPLDSPVTSPSYSTVTESCTEKEVTTEAFINNVLPDRNTCGFQKKRNRLPNAPISSIDEFPWMALLRYHDAYGYDAGFRCAGTLVNKRYVMTSAQCVIADSEAFDLTSVRLGEWSIPYPTDCVYDEHGKECPDKVVDVGVEKKFPHPGYHPDRGNNIALVRLERNIHFTDFVRPICLPVENLEAPPEGTILTTAGWGATLSNGWQLDIKSKIRLPVLSRGKCINTMFWLLRIFEDQICVDAASRSDHCKTDSGGPLMALDEEDKPQWYLEGVIPEGFHCDRRGHLGVYTRVTKYIPWIIFTLGGGGD